MATQTVTLPPHLTTPYTTASAPSMADSLPPLTFAFDDLRAIMTAFTARFDAHISRGRADLLAQRNTFRMSVASAADQAAGAEREIESVRAQTSCEAESVAAHVAEREEMDRAVEELRGARDVQVARAGAVRLELGRVKREVEDKRREMKLRREYLGRHGEEDVREIGVWEGLLGLRIEGTGVEDRIRVAFSDLGARPRSRAGYREKDTGEAWFELDLKDRGWEVVECRPKLEHEDVERCLACVKDGEDLRGFLAGMRKLFLSIVDGSR